MVKEISMKMPHEPYRVLVIDQHELKLAEKLYLPFAQKGIKANAVKDNEVVEEMAPLLCMTLSQHHMSRQIIQIQELRNKFINEFLEEEAANFRTTKKKAKWLTQKKTEITKSCIAILPEEFAPLTESIEASIDEVNNSDNLNKYFQKVLELVTEHETSFYASKTHIELNRGLCVNGIPVSTKAIEGQTATKMLEEKLKMENGEGIDPLLFSFILESLNQDKMMLGTQYFLDAITSIREYASERGLTDSVSRLSWNIEIEDQHSIKLTMDIPYHGLLGKGLQKEMEARGFIQCRVKLLPSELPPATKYGNISVEVLSGYFDIYSHEIRKDFIDRQAVCVASRVRNGKKLMRNHELAIHLQAQDYKVRHEIDSVKLLNISNDHSFLMMWSNLLDAEKLLGSDPRYFPTRFFSRTPAQIHTDLNLIQGKHHYSSSIRHKTECLNQLLTHIENKDVSAIERELAGEHKLEMRNCLYSLNTPADTRFIKVLVESPSIKNNLDVRLLTQFALQDRSIAERLLTPTLGERILYSIRSVLRQTGPNERMPHERFNSEHLKRILETFPEFWHTLFAKPPLINIGARPNYRERLEGAHLRQLINVKQERTPSYYRAVDAVTVDPDLYNKVTGYDSNTRTESTPVSLSERAIYYREHRYKGLDYLYTADRQLLRDFNNSLSDSDLAEFYKSKFELEYQRSPASLITLVVDLWGSSARNAPGANNSWVSLIPAARKSIVAAAAILAVEEKVLTLADRRYQGNHNLPKQIDLSEVFITQPLTSAFFPAGSFDPKQLRKLQDALLNNKSIFHSFKIAELEESEIKELINELLKKASPLAHAHDHQDRIRPLNEQQPFCNPKFIKLVNCTPAFFELFQRLLANNKIQSSWAHFPLATLSKSLLDNKVDLTRMSQVYSLITELFNDPEFIKSLKSYPALEKLFLSTLKHARFMTAVRGSQSLFKKVWAITKRSSPDKLIELITLLPTDKFSKWLKLSNECNYLANRLLQDEVFYKNFIKSQPKTIKNLLLRRVSIANLILLLMKYEDFGSLYLASNNNRDRIERLLKHCSFSELGLLMSKYPELAPSIQKCGLYEPYVEKIESAIRSIYFVIDSSVLPSLREVNPQTKLLIDQINQEEQESSPLLSAKWKSAFKLTLQSKKSLNIANFLIEVINAQTDSSGDGSKDLEFLLRHRKLQRILLDDCTSSAAPTLGSLCSLLSNHIEDDTNKLGARFTHALLQKMITDPSFQIRAGAQPGIRELIAKYGDPELILILLVSCKDSFHDWFHVLDRAALNIEKFKAALPSLQPRSFFNSWWVRHHARNHSQASSSNSSSATAAIDVYVDLSKDEVVKLLKNRAYDFEDLFDLIFRQEEAAYPGEVLIRKCLLEDEELRRIFLKMSYGKETLILTLLEKELERDSKSAIVNSIMSKPYINCFIESLPLDSLLNLLEKLSRNSDDQYHTLLEGILILYKQSDKIRTQVLTTPALFQHCVELASQQNNALELKQFLLFAFNHKCISKELIEDYLVDNSHTVLEAFRLPATGASESSGDQLTQYFLYLAALAKNSNIADSIGSMLIQLLDYDNMKMILGSSTMPELKQQFITRIFEVLNDCDHQDDLKVQIKEHLNALSYFTAGYSILLDELSEDHLIELYVADHVDLSIDGAAGEKSYFRGRILDHSVTLARLFCLAEKSKLAQLLEADLIVAPRFQEMALRDTSVGTALRQRLSDPSSFPNHLIQVLIQQLKVEDACALMSAQPEIHEAFLNELISDPQLLNGDIRFEKYLDYTLEHGTPEQILMLLQSRQIEEKPNTAVAWAYSNIRNKYNQPLGRKLQSYLNLTDDNFADNFYRLSLGNFRPEDIFGLFKDRPEFEATFVRFFQNNHADFEGCFRNNPYNLALFVKFFCYLTAEHKLQIYLLLIKEMPDSYLLTHLKEQFENTDIALALPMLLKANSSQLAQIVNYGKGKDHLSKIIFNRSRGTGGLISRLMESFSDIDEFEDYLDIIHQALDVPVEILTAIEASEGRGDLWKNGLAQSLQIVNSFLHHFKTGPDGLNFRTDQQKTPSDSQHLVYLVALRAELDLTIKSPTLHPNTNSLYLRYLDGIKKIVDYDDQGNLVFRKTRTLVPAESALCYFEGLARFLYKEGDNFVRQLIKAKSGLRSTLIDTVVFNESGYSSFRQTLQIPDQPVPGHYLHLVLYAHCIDNSDLTLPLAKALVRSVEYKFSQISFRGDLKLPKNAELPREYELAVSECILKWLDESPETMVDSRTLLVFFKLMETEEAVVTMLHKNPVIKNELVKNILNSVCINLSGEMICKDTGEQADQLYSSLVNRLYNEKLDTDPSLRLFRYARERQQDYWRVLCDSTDYGPDGNLCYRKTQEETPVHKSILNLSLDTLLKRISTNPETLDSLELVELTKHYLSFKEENDIIIGPLAGLILNKVIVDKTVGFVFRDTKHRVPFFMVNIVKNLFLISHAQFIRVELSSNTVLQEQIRQARGKQVEIAQKLAQGAVFPSVAVDSDYQRVPGVDGCYTNVLYSPYWAPARSSQNENTDARQELVVSP